MARKQNPESDLIVSASGSSAVPSRRKTSAKPRAKHSALVPEKSASEPEVAVAAPVPSESVYEPSREEIAAQAYLYWEARGCQGGSPEGDWLRAEQELRLRARAVTA